jgi:hypothetical protein
MAEHGNSLQLSVQITITESIFQFPGSARTKRKKKDKKDQGVCPERGKWEDMSQSNVGERARPEAWCKAEEGWPSL